METTRDMFLEFSGNRVFWVTFYAWLIAQTAKVVFGVIRERKFNFRWFVGTGGMPSSHAATVSALATVIGLSAGFDSAVFVVALTFAFVVIVDAQGVRRATGKQAGILNRMLEDIYWKHRIHDDRLKELLGHAPIEVFAGIAFGIVTALLLW